MRHSSILASLAGVVLAAGLATAAQAQQAGVQAGFLRCEGGPSVGFAVGSQSTLNCTLRRTRRGSERYSAAIQRVGVDVGVTERWVLGWNVFTPNGRIRRGGLAGQYSGIGSSIAIGTGAGSNAVTGGPGNLVTLQPVPMQGQTGLNVAFGFQGMTLTPRR